MSGFKLLISRWLALAGLALASSAAFGQPVTRLELGTQGNQLAYDQASLRVKAGQAVSLTFTNHADKASSLQHNWVLVRPGSAEKVVTQSIGAGAAKSYVPDSPDVIAHTSLLNPGESATIRFNAPEQPGEYPYLCTFPGHSQLLHGTLTVEK